MLLLITGRKYNTNTSVTVENIVQEAKEVTKFKYPFPSSSDGETIYLGVGEAIFIENEVSNNYQERPIRRAYSGGFASCVLMQISSNKEIYVSHVSSEVDIDFNLFGFNSSKLCFVKEAEVC